MYAPLCIWISLLLSPFALWAQPQTDIYLFDCHWEGDSLVLQKPVNISQQVGYDNQPCFMPDGMSLLYSSQQRDQTEAIRYDITTGEGKALTQSDGSEYSPTPTPDGKHFSTIILEKSGRQLLWQYPLEGDSATILVPDLVIGYHVWLSPAQLFAFVLGEPATLQAIDLATGKSKVIESNIGRALHQIPGKSSISFVHKHRESHWQICSYDPARQSIEPIALTLPGVEDLCWSPEGHLLMGKQSKLFCWRAEEGWQAIASLEPFGLEGITRIAMSPRGDKIAVVVAE